MGTGGTLSRRTATKETDQTALTVTKSLPETTNCTFIAKKWRGTTKKKFPGSLCRTHAPRFCAGLVPPTFKFVPAPLVLYIFLSANDCMSLSRGMSRKVCVLTAVVSYFAVFAAVYLRFPAVVCGGRTAENRGLNRVRGKVVTSKCILQYSIESCPQDETRLFVRLFKRSDISFAKQWQDKFNFTTAQRFTRFRHTKFMAANVFVSSPLGCSVSLNGHINNNNYNMLAYMAPVCQKTSEAPADRYSQC